MSDQPIFRGSPASKVVCFACVALTLIAASNKIQHALIIDSRDVILVRGELWRLLSSLLPSESLAEGLLSWFLLYRFRIFERFMGSAKFTAFVFVALTWAVLSNALLVTLPFMTTGVASGPYCLVFALFVYFQRTLPKLHPNYFSVAGIKFSDKSWVYVLGLQLFFNGGRRSIGPSLAGLLLGLVFTSNLCGLPARLQFPRVMRELWAAPLLHC